jgi:hypothetical protein
MTATSSAAGGLTALLASIAGAGRLRAAFEAHREPGRRAPSTIRDATVSTAAEVRQAS